MSDKENNSNQNSNLVSEQENHSDQKVNLREINPSKSKKVKGFGSRKIHPQPAIQKFESPAEKNWSAYLLVDIGTVNATQGSRKWKSNFSGMAPSSVWKKVKFAIMEKSEKTSKIDSYHHRIGERSS